MAGVSLRDVRKKYGELEVIHFDAHFDVRDTVAGSRYSHSSPIHRISELPFVSRITQFGIRNFASQASLAMAKQIGTVVVPGSEMRGHGPAAAMDKYAPSGKNVYLTIDTDFFDWSIVPGTVLPEPGGFTLQEFRECVQVIAHRSNVVGFDVVCLNPLVDTAWYEVTTDSSPTSWPTPSVTSSTRARVPLAHRRRWSPRVREITPAARRARGGAR
jgi:agmatinase